MRLALRLTSLRGSYRPQVESRCIGPLLEKQGGNILYGFVINSIWHLVVLT